MTKAVLGHEVVVGAVDAIKQAECRLNIKKRHVKVVCKTTSSLNRINVAYCSAENTCPSKNLFISDRSTSIHQNRVLSDLQTNLGTVGSFTLPTDKFLVTDIFTTETATQEATPLFYAHKLKEFNPSNSDWGATKTLTNIQFVDNNFKSKSVTEYYINSSEGKVYNNLSNLYNPVNKTYIVYFIQYTVKISAGVNAGTTTYYELLNNITAFHQASFEDLDELGALDINAKAYLVELAITKDQYIITLPTVSTYAWKEVATSRLKLLPPTALDLSSPWYLRVQNGKLATSLLSNLHTYSYFQYQIAEYAAQSFSPYMPYKFIQNQRAVVLSKKLIYVPKGPVVDSSLGLHIEVLVYDTDNTLTAAYITDTIKIGTSYSTVDYEDGIASYDSLNGFVELSYEIPEDSIVYINYYTEETEYEFTSIDLNPTNNLNTLEYKVAVYIIPETLGTGELNSSLYYLLVDPLGRIIYSSQADENSNGLDPVTQKLLLEDFSSNGAAKHTFYYDKLSTESGLTARISGITYPYIDDFNFIDKYTTESILFDRAITASGTLSSGALLNLIDNPHVLVLGDVVVGEYINPDDITIYDVRVQGGGIKEEYQDTAYLVEPGVTDYWDIGKEIPYPAGGSIYVEVPKNLHTNYGGDYTDQQIRDIIEVHLSAGGYAVLNKYGIDPVITSSIAASGLIDFSWPSYGIGQEYNIYYSADNNNFLLVSGSPYIDTGIENNIILSGLKLQTDYYVYIAGINDGGYDEEGPTVKISTTAGA